VDYRRFEPLAAPYVGTGQTIEEMRRLALAAQTQWPLREVVESTCRQLKQKDYLSELVALHYFVCQHVRYQRDPLTVELVKTPEATLRTGVGDCDDMSTLLAALALLSGAKARFVTVGFRQQGPFTHVYCEGLDPRTNRWVVLDPVAGLRTAEMLGRVREFKTYLVDA
jgi:transglutaminase-like putative cysteine protease